MTVEQMKQWIDKSGYVELLAKWRFAPVGDPFFQGEVGEYYTQVMKRKRNELSPAEHTAASKQIGWER